MEVMVMVEPIVVDAITRAVVLIVEPDKVDIPIVVMDIVEPVTDDNATELTCNDDCSTMVLELMVDPTRVDIVMLIVLKLVTSMVLPESVE
jgi:hypothetical protein